MSKKCYPVRIPRYATGIRAQESHCGGSRSWWAREWANRLEGMGLKARLGRGKNYAASGQVVSLTIDDGHVAAQVVGTRPEPYDVTIDFRMPSGEMRARLIACLREEPIIAARLLAEDLPLEVGTFFKEAGCDLFPGRKLGPGQYDMTTHCTCPDYANPCKHAAAVLLILGEEIARNPATLLKLRGIDMEELYDEN